MALVLWSGGLDSTLLLLDQAKKVKDENKPVTALSIHHGNINSADHEREARVRLREWFKEKGYWVIYTEINIAHEKGWQFGPNQNGGLVQQILWLSLGCQYLGAKEDLFVGYLRGGDIWKHWSEYYEAFRTFQRMMGNKEGQLVAPYSGWHKKEVIVKLRKEKLLDLCVYCEKPIKMATRWKVCGKCDSCQWHQTALYQIRKGW